MKCPKYQQAGLPVTTAWMESLVKEMNYRVNGTKKFWNDPDGAEAILQARAASLCNDERLSKHLRTRAGCPLTCRPKSPKLGTKKSEAEVRPVPAEKVQDSRSIDRIAAITPIHTAGHSITYLSDIFSIRQRDNSVSHQFQRRSWCRSTFAGNEFQVLG
jgi:hypothetical protein